MDKSLILERVKKGIDLYEDKTYELKDLYSHTLQLIDEANAEEKVHKERLEKILYDLDQLQENQQMFWSGHKDKLAICKNLEKALILKKTRLVNMGYDILQFKLKTVQPKLL
jgi:hypothetical protein